MKKLISLDKFNDLKRTSSNWDLMNNNPVLNGISCPKCGSELYDSNPMITLTSMPAQKNTHCSKCNYVGFRIA